jgi:UDP-N-acetylmuramate--alanine ligase
VVVLEADEFDRSFWQLTPSTALITSMDADHLDVYGTVAEVEKGFFGFAARVRENGKLLIKAGLPVPSDLSKGVEVLTYSIDGKADFRVHDLTRKNGLYSFNLETPEGLLRGFTLGIPGLVNVENAVAALALTLMNGVFYEELKEALPRFGGIARRFDVIINSPELVYIDDYAHHPEEIRATLKGVRDAFPQRKITGIFQPHLYSRTRDFAPGFARALNEGLDSIVLLPVYPAREEAIPGVESEMIAEYIGRDKCRVVEKNELMTVLDQLQPDVLITMGAGDIDRLVPEIKRWGFSFVQK